MSSERKSFMKFSILLAASMLCVSCALTWSSSLVGDGHADDQAEEGIGECPEDLANCGGICVNMMSDPEHCGGCDRRCTPPEVCSEGECDSECPTGTIPCSGVCVDTDADINNCGECGNTCQAGINADPACQSGGCSVACHAGWSDPDGDGSCDLECVSSGSEVCNGRDDDCSGACDDGVAMACCSGETGSCTTSCGTDGTRTCLSTCVWDACTPLPGECPCPPPDETCNKRDDDCDCSVDEVCPTRLVFSNCEPAPGSTITVKVRDPDGLTCIALDVYGPCGDFEGDLIDINPDRCWEKDYCEWVYHVTLPASGHYTFEFIHKQCAPECTCAKITLISGELEVSGTTPCT